MEGAGRDLFHAAISRTNFRARPQIVERKLSPEELKQVRELRKADREVRAHERAHKGAAGPYATGGPSYEYTRGPDNRNYATSGEVKIDASKVEGDPQATIRKMQQVRRAALAPKDPSPQDRRVAAEARSAEAAARREVARQRLENGDTPLTSEPATGGKTPESPALRAYRQSASESFPGDLLDLHA